MLVYEVLTRFNGWARKADLANILNYDIKRRDLIGSSICQLSGKKGFNADVFFTG